MLRLGCFLLALKRRNVFVQHFGTAERREIWRPGRDSNPRHARTGECSSVVRVTAVHTLSRLPRAVDRAILPLRILQDGREPGALPGQKGGERDAKIKLSSENRRGGGRVYSTADTMVSNA